MKKVQLLLFVLLATFVMSCKKNVVQTDLIDFEELDTGSSGFWNGSDGAGGFYSGNAYFINLFNNEYQSWSGFSYSNHSDTELGDYTNPYSSITGTGAELSEKYATFYYSGKADTVVFTVAEKISNISVCNSTYAYKVMESGNQFSTKFGGEDGTDPDWFILKITALDNSLVGIGSIEIYLADFRSDNSEQDYISNAWTDIDLSELGFISALVFEMSSSDTGDWGMNTPAYACIDNIEGELISED